MSVVGPTIDDVNAHYGERIDGFKQEHETLKRQRKSLSWFAFRRKRKLDRQIKSLKGCIESAGMIWSVQRRRALRAVLSQ